MSSRPVRTVCVMPLVALAASLSQGDFTGALVAAEGDDAVDPPLRQDQV